MESGVITLQDIFTLDHERRHRRRRPAPRLPRADRHPAGVRRPAQGRGPRRSRPGSSARRPRPGAAGTMRRSPARRRRSRWPAAVALLGARRRPPAADEALTVVSTDVSAYPDVRHGRRRPGAAGDPARAGATVTVTEAGAGRPCSARGPARRAARGRPGRSTRRAACRRAARRGQGGGPVVPGPAAGRPCRCRWSASAPRRRSSAPARPNRARAAGRHPRPRRRRRDRPLRRPRVALTQLQLPGAGSRRMVVLLTDGGDTASAATLDATADALAAAKVPLFAVELRTSESSPAALARLTAASGGRVVPAADPAALAGAFDDRGPQLVRQYAVTYRSQAHGGHRRRRGPRGEGRAGHRPPAPRAPGRRRRDRRRRPTAPAPTPAAAGPDGPRRRLGPDPRRRARAALVLLGLLLAVVLNRTPQARGPVDSPRGVDLGRGDRPGRVGRRHAAAPPGRYRRSRPRAGARRAGPAAR